MCRTQSTWSHDIGSWVTVCAYHETVCLVFTSPLLCCTSFLPLFISLNCSLYHILLWYKSIVVGTFTACFWLVLFSICLFFLFPDPVYVVYRWQELWDRCWDQMDLHLDRLVQLSKSSLQLSGDKVFAKFKNCNCWTWFNMVPVFLHLIRHSCSGIFHISRGSSTV